MAALARARNARARAARMSTEGGTCDTWCASHESDSFIVGMRVTLSGVITRRYRPTTAAMVTGIVVTMAPCHC